MKRQLKIGKFKIGKLGLGGLSDSVIRFCIAASLALVLGTAWAQESGGATNQAPDFSTVTIAEELGVKTDRRSMAAGLYDDNSGRTFVSWMGENSHPYVQAYDEATQTWQTPKQVGNSPSPDSHHYPTIVQAADGHLLVFYGAHNDTPLRLARSPEAASIDGEWADGELAETPYASYPMPIVSSNGDIYVFYRETSDRVDESLTNDVRPLLYAKSTDNGETWTNSQDLTGERYAIGSMERPDNLDEIYMGQITHEPASADRTERFHMVWTIAGGGADEEPKHDRYHRNLYYAYFQPENDHFYSVDGQDLGVHIDNDEMENAAKAVDTGEPRYARGSDDFPGHDVGYTHVVKPLEDGSPLLIFNTRAGENGETKVIDAAQWQDGAWQRSVVAEDQGLLDLEVTSDTARVYLAAREAPGIQTAVSDGSAWQEETFIDLPTFVQRAIVIDTYADPARLLVTGNSDIKEQTEADRNIYVAGVGDMSGVTVEDPPSENSGNQTLEIEAESAADQAAFAPFMVVEDAEASGGSYITTDEELGDSNESAPEDGVATFEVDIDGTVAVWLRVKFANNGSNSMWIRSNDDSFAKFDEVDAPEKWMWLKWTEKSGIDSVSVARREDGTILDKILITSDLMFEPQ